MPLPSGRKPDTIGDFYICLWHQHKGRSTHEPGSDRLCSEDLSLLLWCLFIFFQERFAEALLCAGSKLDNGLTDKTSKVLIPRSLECHLGHAQYSAGVSSCLLKIGGVWEFFFLVPLLSFSLFFSLLPSPLLEATCVAYVCR